MKKTAIISKDEFYRYELDRIWDTHLPVVYFIGLNPSTADANKDDPTIRRCIGFAKQFGCGGITMLNLFAYRATSPKEMKKAEEPIGNENNLYLQTAVLTNSNIIVCWGNHGSFGGRSREVVEQLSAENKKLYCFGITKSGELKHPLYLSYQAKLETYKPILF